MRAFTIFFFGTCTNAFSLTASTPTWTPSAASTSLRTGIALLAKDSGVRVDDSLLRDGAMCSMLDEHQRSIVRDLLGRECSEQDTLFECDMPANDSSLTCFLLPESWHMNSKNSRPKWLCMANPHPSNVMEYEDGY